MKKRIYALCGLFMLFLCLPFYSQAQNRPSGARPSGLLKGKVVSAEGEVPLEFATISVMSKRDSSIVGGGITDADGFFEISTRPGRLWVTIEYLSFQKKTIDSIFINRQQTQLDLGVISMEEDAKTLEEVEVTAERNQVEFKLDKRVFNVNKDLNNAGANAAEILDNLPSVEVDIEGNVSLRGSQGVRILIDGKPSGLIGARGTDALRQLQGDIIEKIEIITNPSARYEAEGEVGIINIVLKKGRKKGVNGSFGLRAGDPANYGASYSLNFRKKDVNFFSNFGLNYRSGPGKASAYQEYFENGDLVIFESDRTHNRSDFSGNIQLGTDWYINPKNTLTASLLYRHSTGTNESELIYRDLDEFRELINTTTRMENEDEDETDMEAALSYQREFNKPDQKWTIDLKFIQNEEIELADYMETSTTAIPDAQQRSNNEEDQLNWLFQTDYIHPFGEEGMFEMGLRVQLRHIDNDFAVEEWQEGETWVVSPDFNDHMEYTENIYAGYVMAGNQWNNFSAQVGLRAEYSDINTYLRRSDLENPRNYLNLFPSAHLSYELSESNQVQLSYSRRISRPRFWYLLPFLTFSDNRNLFSGNPNLNPEYTNSMELGYLKYFPKGSFLSSVYYRHRTGVIERITIPNDDGTTRRLPVNLSTQHAFGLEFNVSYDLAQWWKTNASFNFYRAITEGSYEGESLEADTYTWNTRFNSRWAISKKLDTELSFNYRAPRETTQGRTRSIYSINLGASKEILNDKGTLTLSVRDLLNSRKRRSVTDFPGFYSESEFQWRVRQVLLSFTYRLNQKKRRGGRGGNRGGYGDDMEF